jgi:hypothetical protein
VNKPEDIIEELKIYVDSEHKRTDVSNLNCGDRWFDGYSTAMRAVGIRMEQLSRFDLDDDLARLEVAMLTMQKEGVGDQWISREEVLETITRLRDRKGKEG